MTESDEDVISANPLQPLNEDDEDNALGNSILVDQLSETISNQSLLETKSMR